MEVKFFRKENGRSPVEDFIEKLKPADYKRTVRAIERVEMQPAGLANLFKSEYLKKLEEDIYELKPDRIRILTTLKDRCCWLLHIFFKKSQKTPAHELEIARQRKNIIFNNN